MLFQSFDARSIHLANRIVMSPMTRSRAVEANVPNALMAEYYGQRATAGLIITEGTSPSPNGLGYARIPGAFNEAQTAGWAGVCQTTAPVVNPPEPLPIRIVRLLLPKLAAARS